jgi:hypothetical protein
MSAAEELTQIIMSPESFDGGPVSCGPNPVSATRTADAVIAAGYSKPRTITTVEELDALPRLAVVRPRAEMSAVLEKHTMWHEAGSRDLVTSSEIFLPATVLWEPEATA